MNTKTTPVASLGALLAAITDLIAGAEQRVMVRLDDVENRIVGLEDKLTETGKQAEEVHDDLVEKLGEVREMVKEISTDSTDDVIGALDELVDAERRRERLGWLADVRRAS